MPNPLWPAAREPVQLLRLHGGRSLGDLDRPGGAALDALAREIVGSCEPERPIGDHPNADAQRLGVGGAADLAVLGRQRAIALVDDARFGQRCAAQLSRLQRPCQQFLSSSSPAVDDDIVFASTAHLDAHSRSLIKECGPADSRAGDHSSTDRDSLQGVILSVASASVFVPLILRSGGRGVEGALYGYHVPVAFCQPSLWTEPALCWAAFGDSGPSTPGNDTAYAQDDAFKGSTAG